MVWNRYRIYWARSTYDGAIASELRPTHITNRARSVEESQRKAAKLLGRGQIQGFVKAVLQQGES